MEEGDTLLAGVYRSSFQWAKLGNSTLRSPFGELVWNTENPGHWEGNCVWYFDAKGNVGDAMAAVRRHFQRVGNRCHHWIPALGAVEAGLAPELARMGMLDCPSAGMALRLPSGSDLPKEFEAIDARARPDQLDEVFTLAGQRWAGGAARARARSALALDDFESYVCLWRGEVAGRVGLLRSPGPMARLKSVFVGGPFRRVGVGRAMMNYAADRASALGYQWLASEVDLTNAPSLACHRAVGFLPVGMLHCYAEAP